MTEEKRQVRKISRKVSKKQINKQFPVSENQIADAAVSTNKLTDGAVSTDKLGDGAVSTDKLGDGAVSSAKIASFSVGASKLGGIVTRSSAVTNVANNNNASAQVSCESGERVLGGGFNAQAFANNLLVLASRPSVPGNAGSAAAPHGSPLQQWRVSVRNTSGAAQQFRAWAVCATDSALATASGGTAGDGGPAAP